MRKLLKRDLYALVCKTRIARLRMATAEVNGDWCFEDEILEVLLDMKLITEMEYDWCEKFNVMWTDIDKDLDYVENIDGIILSQANKEFAETVIAEINEKKYCVESIETRVTNLYGEETLSYIKNRLLY